MKMHFGGFHLWLCTLTMALVKEVCQKSPNSAKEWGRGTEGCGEILRTELNLPQVHNYCPKFQVGPNLKGHGSFSVGSCLLLLKAVQEASRDLAVLENSQLCALMSSCVPVLLQALPSGEDDEDDSDSDSDDDDVKVTIGNIKTGAPSYMWVLLGVGLC